MKNKAQRIADTKKIQRKRTTAKEAMWERALSFKEKGKLKSGNMSCGCTMCKPWKHKIGGEKTKMKISDRKRCNAKLDK